MQVSKYRFSSLLTSDDVSSGIVVTQSATCSNAVVRVRQRQRASIGLVVPNDTFISRRPKYGISISGIARLK
jgi:hypothetical protein